MSDAFVLGVNYWPRNKAMYWWSDFDRDEVNSEFSVIRDLGLGWVRLFLLWDDFQPDPTSVSEARLAELRQVCDAALERGLKLNVTFFTGHMSGPNWSPRWLLAGKREPGARQLVSEGRIVDAGVRNPYTDPEALAAERLLIESVVGALEGHAGVGLYNLGNEPDLFAVPPNAERGRAWVRDAVGWIRGVDPSKPVNVGLHVDSLRRDNGLRIDQIFQETDAAVMHAYSMYSPYARSPLDPDWVPYTCALTRALCRRPVLMEEFGGCIAPHGAPSTTWDWMAYGKPRRQFMASETDFARYLEETLPRLIDVGATGAYLWCYADYAEHLFDRPPCAQSRHERHFGLVRSDGSLKPHAEVLRKFSASSPKVRTEGYRKLELPITPDEYYEDAEPHYRELYQEYLQGA